MTTHSEPPCACGAHPHDDCDAHIASPVDELVTVRDWLRHAVSRMNAVPVYCGHGCDNSFDEAIWLITSLLHLPPAHLETFLDAGLLASERETLARALDRRCDERIPTAYITGEAWLGGFSFRVDPRVIIPRSYFVDHLLDGLAPWVSAPDEVQRVLDLCCGSGCLAILAAHVFPRAEVTAIDISPDALAVARENVARYGLENRIDLIQADLFASMQEGDRFDLIVCNPPYVTEAAMQALPAEYRHEPALALAAGEDGMDVVRRVLQGARAHLTPKGLLAVEIGHNRREAEMAFPKLPFIWLNSDGHDEAIFLLAAADLPSS